MRKIKLWITYGDDYIAVWERKLFMENYNNQRNPRYWRILWKSCLWMLFKTWKGEEPVQ